MVKSVSAPKDTKIVFFGAYTVYCMRLFEKRYKPMKTKFFADITINSAEDIKNAVSRFQSFVFADGEKEVATKELLTLIADHNETLKASAVGAIANADNILSALVPSITIDEKTAKSDRLRKKAVYNAVSYVQYKVTEKDGKHEIRQTEKAVTIRDIFDHLCNIYANGHADMKIRKEDRTKAENRILTADAKHALHLFMVGAYRFENVADILKGVSVKADTDTESKLFLESTPSKANAEKQIKHTAVSIGFGEIAFRRSHALTLYKRAYAVDKFHQAKTVSVLDFAQDFIISARYAKNAIEMPDIIDKAGIFVADEIPKVDNVITF